MSVQPETGRYLKNIENGMIVPWTELLAKQSFMIECNAKGATVDISDDVSKKAAEQPRNLVIGDLAASAPVVNKTGYVKNLKTGVVFNFTPAIGALPDVVECDAKGTPTHAADRKKEPPTHDVPAEVAKIRTKAEMAEYAVSKGIAFTDEAVKTMKLSEMKAQFLSAYQEAEGQNRAEGAAKSQARIERAKRRKAFADAVRGSKTIEEIVTLCATANVDFAVEDPKKAKLAEVKDQAIQAYDATPENG